MESFKSYLMERSGMGEVRLAANIYKNADSEIKHLLGTWETANWVGGRLEQAFNSNDDVAKAIMRASQPIRDAIHKREGKTITLYRGMENARMNAERHGNRPLYSWTSRPNMASLFAGNSQQVRGKIVRNSSRKVDNPFEGITPADAKRAQQQMQTRGKAIVGPFRLSVSPFNPDYCDIKIRKSGRIKEYADERIDGLAAWFERQKEYIEQEQRDMNKRYGDEGIVVKQEIPVDDIVWVLNAGGSMEYIVRGHSGSKGKPVDF